VRGVDEVVRTDCDEAQRLRWSRDVLAAVDVVPFGRPEFQTAHMGVMPGVRCLALFVGASSGMQPRAATEPA
jgi:predicted nucleotidyltransferase